MDLLILGGTALLGQAIAQAALDRGHAVTCLARGSSSAPKGATFISADRDDDDGLASVASRSWAAVIDVSRQPGQVRRPVRDLSTQHWVFISSGNVYADFSTVEQDENAPLRPPLQGEVMEAMLTYGEAKVACENAVRASNSSATIVRSGLIGGRVIGRAGPGNGHGDLPIPLGMTSSSLTTPTSHARSSTCAILLYGSSPPPSSTSIQRSTPQARPSPSTR